jgi:uncharacterized membrane protein
VIADPANLLAILLMAAATYATRAAGFLLARRLPRSGSVRVALDALPPAVLTAVIAPAVMAGPAEAIAAVVTMAVALRLPLLVTVVVAVGSIVVLRQVLG